MMNLIIAFLFLL